MVDRIVELIDIINTHNRLYAEGRPMITDSEYHGYWRELRDLDPENELLYHTGRIRTDGLFKTIQHTQTKLSIDKCFTPKDLRRFFDRYSGQHIDIQPKYDGVCATYYTTTSGGDSISGLDQTLALAGDGSIGGVISHRLKDINLNLLNIVNKAHVDGELIILNRDWSKEYGANPRNTVAGWTNPKSFKDIPTKVMTFMPHDAHTQCVSLDKVSAEELWNLCISYYEEWKLLFPIDGLVLKVSDQEVRKRDGHNGNFPYWAIAWKPEISTAETEVTDVEWNVSRTGRVVPTIIYTPVNLCGTINTRATSNNAMWVKENGIAIGNKIKIGKAGEIIPKILSSDNRYPSSLPDTCPVCNSKLEQDHRYLVCRASDCVTQSHKRITHFYSVIDVKGIGPASIEALLNYPPLREAIINKPWLLLTKHEIVNEAMITILGDGTTYNINESIRNANNKYNAAHLMAALGYDDLGYKNALKLLQNRSAKVPYKALASFAIALRPMIEAATKLKEFQFHFTSLPKVAEKTFCVTGTFACPREDIITLLAERGWEFKAGVSKHCNVLFVGTEPGKTKLDKALKIGTQIMGENELSAMLQISPPV